jgi:hypothetical protein
LERRNASLLYKRFLGGQEVSSARSWAGLRERTAEHLQSGALDEETLVEFFANLQLTAHKAYSLHRMEQADRRALIKRFDRLKLNEEFKKTYPIPVSQSALKEADDEPVPTAVVTTDAGTSLILCSPRRFISRRPIPPEHLTEGARRDYVGATLFADRRGVFQAFDVIFVSRHEDYVQVRTDIGEDRLDEEISVLQAGVIDALHDIIEKSGETELPGPIDLFPAVKSIYEDKKEGRVCELYFDRTSGVNARDAWRRKNAGDLRTESFHVAGKKVSQVTPYRISVAWKKQADPDDEIEAHLPGTIRMLANDGGLYSCYLVGVPTEEEVEFMLGRILEHATK